jgi:hypothetical protein
MHKMKSSLPYARIATTLSLFLGMHEAAAQEPRPPSLPTIDPASLEPDPVDDLQSQLDELKLEMRRKEEQQRNNASRLSINGYVDIGAFVPLGNDGVGWVRDNGNRQFPDRANFSWTFLGDILATAVNTRGEPADLGDAPGITRYDSIDSDGAAGLLVNEVNLRIGYQLADRALLRTSINFAPRSAREDFALGDTTDVDVAELEYVLTADGKTSFFVGKTLPVFGIEYKEHKSDQRFGITPSLANRYTAGPQLGIKFRSKLLHDWIILAAAISNNSSVTEPFHFYSEIDKNWGKTLSSRVAVSFPMGLLLGMLDGDRLELGGSGLWGPQDRASDNKGKTLFWGFDLQYLSADYAVKGQFMKGKSPGLPTEQVWELDLKRGGYLEANWQMFSFLGLLARAGLRDAEVILGTERLYITKSLQFTGGVRVTFNPRVVLKLEYVKNREYGGIAEFNNDLATSSLVLGY